MHNPKYYIAGSAIALAVGMLAAPASAQEVCVTTNGVTTGPSGAATGGSSFSCGAGSTASGFYSEAIGIVARATMPIASE